MAAPQRLVVELSAGCQLWLSKPWNTDAERTRRPNTILWYFSIRRIVRDVKVDGSRGITAIVRQTLSTASHIWKRSGRCVVRGEECLHRQTGVIICVNHFCISQALPCCWCFSEDLDDTQAAFPPFEQLWEGGAFKFLGSGIYYKKILFISVQVIIVVAPKQQVIFTSHAHPIGRLSITAAVKKNTVLMRTAGNAGVCSGAVCGGRQGESRAAKAACRRVLCQGLFR